MPQQPATWLNPPGRYYQLRWVIAVEVMLISLLMIAIPFDDTLQAMLTNYRLLVLCWGGLLGSYLLTYMVGRNTVG